MAASEETEDASATSKDKWFVSYENKDHSVTCYCLLKFTNILLLRRKSLKWHLYIYGFDKATAVFVSKPTNNTLEAALEAFKDWLVKIDRVVPLLPQTASIAGWWDCPICGERCYAPKDIQHVEEHLTVTKSASKT
jgi:hypothetical protein